MEATVEGLTSLTANSGYFLTLYLKFNIIFQSLSSVIVKGAVREIRKDNQFLAKQKLKEQLER